MRTGIIFQGEKIGDHALKNFAVVCNKSVMWRGQSLV